jgi:hypothetical protein
VRTWDCRTPFRVIEQLPVEVSAVSRNCCYQGDCTHWPTSGPLRFFADFNHVPLRYPYTPSLSRCSNHNSPARTPDFAGASLNRVVRRPCGRFLVAGTFCHQPDPSTRLGPFCSGRPLHLIDSIR